MTDIVERLRALEAWIRKPDGVQFSLNTDLFDEAADEIERLRAALEDIAYPNPVHGEDQLMNIARAALEGPQVSKPLKGK